MVTTDCLQGSERGCVMRSRRFALPCGRSPNLRQSLLGSVRSADVGALASGALACGFFRDPPIGVCEPSSGYS
jgi:hypothetical protein